MHPQDLYVLLLKTQREMHAVCPPVRQVFVMEKMEERRWSLVGNSTYLKTMLAWDFQQLFGKQWCCNGSDKAETYS